MGKRMCNAFAVSGCTKIAILGRTASTLEETKKEVEGLHPGILINTYIADVADADAVGKALEETEKTLGKINILVSNAAYLPHLAPLVDSDIDEWFKGMVINFKGPMILAQQFVKHCGSVPVFITRERLPPT